jgi:predicted TIM-barrel fold metal-dependent hydrolase
MAIDHAIISADDHMDLMALPPSLWSERLPRSFATRAPRVEDRDGAPVWIIEERVVGPSGRKPGHLLQTVEHGFRPGRPETRLEDMERDGVYAQVIYGPVRGLPIRDPALRTACLAAYNDWAAEFSGVAPNRLIVLAMLPAHEPSAATAELERCSALGHRGVLLSPFESNHALFGAGWERFWDAAQATGSVLHFHLGEGHHGLQALPGSWQLPACVATSPLQLDETLAALLLSGVLERRTALRAVLGESGLGWLPYVLERLDHEHEKYRGRELDYRPRVKPSEIFRSQVLATYQEEDTGLELLDRIGIESVMWASDYPHGDSTWPDSIATLERSKLGRRDPGDLRRIAYENAAQLYGIRGPGASEVEARGGGS